eukprot:gene5793-biopygen14824
MILMGEKDADAGCNLGHALKIDERQRSCPTPWKERLPRGCLNSPFTRSGCHGSFPPLALRVGARRMHGTCFGRASSSQVRIHKSRGRCPYIKGGGGDRRSPRDCRPESRGIAWPASKLVLRVAARPPVVSFRPPPPSGALLCRCSFGCLLRTRPAASRLRPLSFRPGDDTDDNADTDFDTGDLAADDVVDDDDFDNFVPTTGRARARTRAKLTCVLPEPGKSMLPAPQKYDLHAGTRVPGAGKRGIHAGKVCYRRREERSVVYTRTRTRTRIRTRTRARAACSLPFRRSARATPAARRPACGGGGGRRAGRAHLPAARGARPRAPSAKQRGEVRLRRGVHSGREAGARAPRATHKPGHSQTTFLPHHHVARLPCGAALRHPSSAHRSGADRATARPCHVAARKRCPACRLWGSASPWRTPAAATPKRCVTPAGACDVPMGGARRTRVPAALGYWLPSAVGCPRLLAALGYWLPSAIGCPRLLAALGYWLPSAIGCPRLLAALGYWLPSATGCPRLLAALGYWLPSAIGCPWLLAALGYWLPSAIGCPQLLTALYWLP